MAYANVGAEDIGRLILSVQEDLKNIRTSLQNFPGGDAALGDTNTHIVYLESTLQRAEQDLRTKAEKVLSNMMQTHETTSGAAAPLPIAPAIPASPLARKRVVGMQRSGSSLHPSSPYQDVLAEHDRSLLPDATRHDAYRTKPRSVEDLIRARYGLREDTRVEYGRAVGKRPSNTSRRANKVSRPARLLPRVNRSDPSAPPPAITEEDIGRGVLDLMNRGFIPPNVDLTPAFERGAPTVVQRPVRMHDYNQQFLRYETYSNPYSTPNIKLDLITKVESTPRVKPLPTPSRPSAPRSAPAQVFEFNALAAPTAISPLQMDNVQIPPGQQLLAITNGFGSLPIVTEKADAEEPLDVKSRTYNELLDTYSLHQFIIRKGKTLDSTPEFQSFRRKYDMQWHGISIVIQALERFFSYYGVPVAYIDGRKVVTLAEQDLKAPSPSQLLDCVVNLEQVAPIIRVPGKRFKTNRGEALAATAIQSYWRMFKCHRSYTHLRLVIRCASVIQQHVRLFKEVRTTRALIAARKQKEMDKWHEMMNDFKLRWNLIRTKKRVEVHIPSLSYDECKRMSMENFISRQNGQIGRLFSAADPSVEVVYVCPFTINQDVINYYYGILDIGRASDAKSRITLITPESTGSYPSHFSLASLVQYAPRCIKRIKSFCAGREAYIVPGYVGADEIKLSVQLGIPILGSLPEITNLYSSKSGAKRIFALADVSVPTGAYDIYDKDEFVLTLARLIATNIDTERWLFKIDDEFGGRGIAYFDVRYVKIMEELRRKRDREALVHPEVWFEPAIQDVIREKLLEALVKALPKRVNICMPRLYPSWNEFLTEFTRVGGVIEAVPAHILGSPTASILVEPSGDIKLLSTADQLFSRPYVYAGAVIPQQSVSHKLICLKALSVGNILYDKGYIGYASIDFVFTQDPQVPEPVLYGVDLNLHMADLNASFSMFSFLAGGQYNKETGQYLIERKSSAVIADSSNPKEPTEGQEWVSRSVVVCNYVFHPSLMGFQHNAFFHMCKLEGISFNLELKVGLSFLLMDSLASGVLGMVAVGISNQDALKKLMNGLQFIAIQASNQSSSSIVDSLQGRTDEILFLDLLGSIRNLLKAPSKVKGTPAAAKTPAHRDRSSPAPLSQQ
eukprot:GILJ01007522.1.p1 GENE.GILJ01007522.1~~GILJ01007522.1.p1  ORF type:complete len:1129 (-),score=134.43 GILJ01007522.1:199-3585(-)